MDSSKKFIPQHQKVFNTIADRIRFRKYKYGEKLPAMQALCDEFGVSPITVKTAIKKLREAGMIKTVRGNGAFAVWKRENDYYYSSVPAISRSSVITHSLFSPTPAYEYTMSQLADTFMRNNPHIRVKFVKIRPKGADDPYLQMIAGGDLPNCGEFFWHAVYARLNALYPLEQLEDFQELQSDLLPQAAYPTADGDNNNHIHALYVYLGLPSFYVVNPDLFRRCGMKTPQQNLPVQTFYSFMQRFAEKSGNPAFYAAAINAPESYRNVKFYLEMMGQDVFADNYSANSISCFHRIFGTESAVLALEYLRKMQESGRMLFQQSHEYFALGKVGVLPCGSSWTINLIDMLNPQLEYLALPHLPVGTNNIYRPFHAGFSVGIFRRSITSDAQLAATWEWLRFFFHRRSQYLLSQTLKIPVRKDADSYLQEQRPLTNQLGKQLLANSVPQHDFVGQRQCYSIAGQRIRLFLQSKTSPEKCLREIQDALSYLR